MQKIVPTGQSAFELANSIGFEKTLEEIHSLPEVTEKVEEEWKDTCYIQLGVDIPSKTIERICPNEVVANIQTKCPFCGLKPVRGACEKHVSSLLAGKVFCSPCSFKANTKIFVKVVKAIWKQDD